MGRLTTHVLDTAQGKPAAGVFVSLYWVEIADEVEGHEEVLSARTNADGRTDGPLLDGRGFRAGTYELLFFVGEYFAAQPVATAEPPFYDLITLRFTVADAAADYHVPLLVSPWAYSTYRGS
jgi:5-hydroxyisourate hydrolase